MCEIRCCVALIRPDVVRSEAFGLGCLLAVMITFVHVMGLDGITNLYSKKTHNLVGNDQHPFVASWYFGETILLMLLLHIVDTCIWGAVLYGMKLIPNIHDAFYFAANTYTSLGYGEVPLGLDWRELSPLMAISGLFTFACTTGQLFNVMGQHRGIVAELRAKREEHAAAVRRTVAREF